jgi:superfamily II DNA/RNA helicase
MSTTFAHLGLPQPITDALGKQGLSAPFPIQEATIPDALAGRDVCGMAPTGSGKTLAFGLPMLARVETASPRRPRALILSPTRELAAQIRKDLAPYGKAMHAQVFAVYGGVRYPAQREWLDRGVEVLVATPGRLEDLIDQKFVDLSDVSIVAVDEADRMADMGFLPAVRRILNRTAKDRQTLLFSATLDGDVAVLIREYQTDPVRHDAAPVASSSGEARHHFWGVERADKVETTAELVNGVGRSIVFTRTRHGADRLAKQLSRLGVDAIAIHGGRTQGQRNKALARLSSGEEVTLIATDVAARGIHVDDVACVVHYDPPNDSKDYVHRSGRTARAGATGSVVSLVQDSERRSVGRMQRDLGMSLAVVRPDVEAVTSHAGMDPDRRIAKAPVRAEREPDAVRRRTPEAPRHEAQPRRGNRTQAPSQASLEKMVRTGATGDDGSKTLHVGNLAWRVREADLIEHFSRYGTVHHAVVPTDRSGRSKGYALVDMHVDDAHKAVKGLQGATIAGRPIKVKVSRPPTQRRRTR